MVEFSSIFYLGPLLLAAEGLPTLQRTPGVWQDIVILTAFALALLLILLGVSRYIYARRKRRKHHSKSHSSHRHHRSHSSSSKTSTEEEPKVTSSGESEKGETSDHSSAHHRRKKKRREHRPRFPTLAETGGLPPKRTRPPGGSGQLGDEPDPSQLP